jgi:hypothetical protein
MKTKHEQLQRWTFVPCCHSLQGVVRSGQYFQAAERLLEVDLPCPWQPASC